MAAFGKSGVTSGDVGVAGLFGEGAAMGEEIPIEVAISVDHSTGRPLYTAICPDITEARAQRCGNCRKAASGLLLATKIRKHRHLDWDLLTNRMVWDARMHELYGLRAGDFSGAIPPGRRVCSG